MIISEQWLRDWVNVDMDAQEIADCLTNAGLEVDGVEPVGAAIENLVVGRVISVEKHPDADRLNLTKVDVGTEVLSIVCGASNVREGLIAPVATIGAKLPNGLKIKKAKVRGIESFGMLCSASELGLAESSDGLLELDDDAQLGDRIDDYLQLNDSLIDIDLTPNRGDCLSVQGIARELQVLADAEYHPLAVEPLPAQSDEVISVDVLDQAACPKYLSRVITELDASAKTPLWMQEKLRRSGLSSISAIVDVTNYVMLELGQPLHAFDHSKLNEKLVVRKSQAGEKIKLLDDSEATLDDDTLVIADAKAPVAIAGVMGGLDSAIDTSSTNIVLEAAHFTRSIIAGRARRYGLHTDSSHRFERGVDPELPELAIERASELIVDICGGQLGPVNGVNASTKPKPSVALGYQRLKTVLGMELSQDDVSSILQRVCSSVEVTEQGWQVQAPSYRFDIVRECDLVEEVARVKGYDNIPTTMPRIVPTSIVASEDSVSERSFRQAIIARDYREAITYSFIDPQEFALFNNETPVNLTNPLAENMSVMRGSLLPGLLNAVKFNHNRQRERIRLFEVGATYLQGANGTANKIVEKQKMAGVVTGAALPTQWGVTSNNKVDFFDIKSDVESLLNLTGRKELFIFKWFEHIALHPGQVSLIKRGEQEVGWLGKLHPTLQKHYGIQTDVFVFEIDLNIVLKSSPPSYQSVSRFPVIKRDLSILVDSDVAVDNMIHAVKQKLGAVLSKVVLFDVYSGQGIGENQKSVSLSLTLKDNNKTMTDNEAEKWVGEALAVLAEAFDARLRA